MMRVQNADEQHVCVFENGRKAARTGAPLTSNPYVDRDQPQHVAWADGFNSVDLTAIERGRIFMEGQSAASRNHSASTCPYVNDENPELMEIWLLGYAPYVAD